MTDQVLMTLDRVMQKMGDVVEDFMYPIEPVMGILIDGTGAFLVMAGWLDGVLCAVAIPALSGPSVGKQPALYYRPEGESAWSPNTTSPAGGATKDFLFHIESVLRAVHLGYMKIPPRYLTEMAKGAQQNETA